MRADRLLSLVLLLQNKRRVSATRISRELEVSVRTVYRDIEALSASGIPVYGEKGRAGGYSLLDDFKAQPLALTEGEVGALSMLDVPGPLSELGVKSELKAALLKLASTFPERQRAEQERVRNRLYLDWKGWTGAPPPADLLLTIKDAVWGQRCLRMTYVVRPFGISITRDVEPYGLVGKAGTWYLVYSFNGRFRVRRVAEITAATAEESRFERRPGFDLAVFWAGWCEGHARAGAGYEVTVTADPRVVPGLIARARRVLAVPSPAPATSGGPSDWVALNLAFSSLEEARGQLLQYGAAVKVLSPRALQCSIVDYALRTAGLYEGDPA